MTLEERIKEYNSMKISRCYANACDIAEDIIRELQTKNKELEIKLLEKDKKLYICESNRDFFKKKLKELNNEHH